MKRKITMVQYGCGKMSAYTMRYALEKGIQIVGAFDIDPAIIGKDIAQIMHSTSKKKVLVQDAKEFDNFLKGHDVDVVIVTTRSLLSEVYDALMICAKNGVNAITTCEEAFFPQNSNPNMFAELDEVAAENGATITGSGFQDVFWGNLLSVIAGSTHKLKRIRGTSSYNVEDYGIALAEAHGAGLTQKEFEEKIACADNILEKDRDEMIKRGEFVPSYMWNVNGWLASKLGLHVERQFQKTEAMIADRPLHSSTLGMTIDKDQCTGMGALVATFTKEGVIIETECIGKVYAPGETDIYDWTVEGESETTIKIDQPDTVRLTCAAVINRIPEVLCAPPGFMTTDIMPENTYKVLKLDKYVEEVELDDEDFCEHEHCHHGHCADDCQNHDKK